MAAQALLYPCDDDARARARDDNRRREAILTLLLRPAAVLQVDEAGWARFTRITPILLLDGWHRCSWIGGLVGIGDSGMLFGVRISGAHLDCVMEADLTEGRILCFLKGQRWI